MVANKIGAKNFAEIFFLGVCREESHLEGNLEAWKNKFQRIFLNSTDINEKELIQFYHQLNDFIEMAENAKSLIGNQQEFKKRGSPHVRLE